ncbi:MAG TPA: metallophosphatase domain-containing protein [Polyangium sp.]|nr:metallophosphatase domain-containing protein [Polyangium sp.]
MRLVLLSDTHRMHDRIVIPEGDVLIHAGDFCGHGTRNQALAFAQFFRALPHRHKVVIAGNHDRCLELEPELGKEIFTDCHYLFDSGVEIEGLKFWGSPWQPWFLDWAFNLPRGPALRAKWDLIPENTDVLITHGPPMGILDRTFSGEPVGCADLREVVDRIGPRLHVFGHIHEGHGQLVLGKTRFVNASICTLSYDPTNPAAVIDL